MPSLINFLSLEGNIGSTKTTFLGYLEEYAHVLTIPEDVDMFTNFKGKYNFLKAISEKDVLSVGSFQNMAFMNSVFSTYDVRFQRSVVVSDRSPFSQKKIFWPLLLQQNLLNELQCDTLNFSFELLEWHGIIENPDLLVYLRSSPESCLSRAQARGRPEEKNLSLEYLTQCHLLHESWLREPSQSDGWEGTYIINVDDKTPTEMRHEALKLINFVDENNAKCEDLLS